MSLTLRQLRYFLAAVDAGSMTRAAEIHHVAPTALSLQLKLMEDAYGVALLERHARGVRPTEQGVALYQRGRQILSLVSDAEAHLAGVAARTRRVIRLGIPPAIARLIAGQAIMGIGNTVPGAELQITEGWSGELAEQVAAGTLDLVLGYGVARTPGLRTTEIAEEHFVLAGAADLELPDRPVTLAEALEHPLVFYGRHAVAWGAVHDAAAGLGRIALVRQEVNSIEAWRQLIILGEGVAITPLGAISDEAATGRIQVRPLRPPGIVQRVGLACRLDGAGDPLLAAVQAYLIDLARIRYRTLGPHCVVMDDLR